MIDTLKQEEAAPFSDKPMWLNAMIRFLCQFGMLVYLMLA